MRCCICCADIEGWGNNPWPVSEKEDDRCCDLCNEMVVIPARIKQIVDKQEETNMFESKREVVGNLCTLLQSTSALSNIQDMTYTKEDYDEWVYIEFDDGTTLRVCVNCDSGIAIINDVLKALRDYM